MRIAALDIGGTSIKSGIWNGEEITEQKEWDTNASRGGAYLMERVSEILRTCGSFDAIGISTAGQVDRSKGSIYYANDNIPNYTGMEIRRILEEEFGVPVEVENDVNAAALGELHFGAAKGADSFLCLTYGTGVGGAIVIDGKVFSGHSYSGGGFGGIVIHPEDMRPDEEFSGCYEKCASTTALVRRVKEVDASLDNGRKIFESFERPEVRRQIDEWIDEIVCGLVTLIHIFNPSDILLGGGVLAQPYIIGEVRRRVEERISPGFRGTRLVQTSLGNQAGLMGAAWLACERMGKQSYTE
ncbi:MAG: ROK family protein [Clostridiales bacterium]|nr:ROK family protein [Clostridiales bacterium]